MLQAAAADRAQARDAGQAGDQCKGEGGPEDGGPGDLQDQLPGPTHHGGLVQAARGAHREDLQQEPAVQVPLEHGGRARVPLLSGCALRATAWSSSWLLPVARKADHACLRAQQQGSLGGMRAQLPGRA